MQKGHHAASQDKIPSAAVVLGRLCKPWRTVCSCISMHRGDLTNEQWARLAPLLLAQKPTTGRPNLDYRRIINGILWILCIGAPWADLPARYGTRGIVSSRSYRWRQADVWDRIFADLQAQVDRDGTLDWTIHFVDSPIVRAHQHAGGAKGAVRV